jgi:hypothetical protein
MMKKEALATNEKAANWVPVFRRGCLSGGFVLNVVSFVKAARGLLCHYSIQHIAGRRLVPGAR